MKFLALIVIVLGVISARQFKDTKSILAQMETSQYGQAMLSLLQSHQAGLGGINEVVGVLNQLVEDLTNDQERADKKNATDQESCNQNINAYVQTISKLKGQISGLEVLIEENEGILKLAQTTLAQAKADYAEVVEEIRSSTEQREKEHAEWEERDKQANIDIVTLEEGVRLIQHMLHGVSFSEIQGRYTKMLAQLGSSKQQTLYKPLVSQLTQLTAKLNFDNVQKVLDLLESMRKSVVDERAADLANEQQQQKDFEILLAQLKRQKKQLENKIAKNEKIIEVTTELLKNSRVSLANAQASLENNQSLLKKEEEFCADASATYLTETDERDREQEVLAKLLEHISERQQAVTSYLDDRAANREEVVGA